jgi:hypothetical protein
MAQQLRGTPSPPAAIVTDNTLVRQLGLTASELLANEPPLPSTQAGKPLKACRASSVRSAKLKSFPGLDGSACCSLPEPA